jgi:hypothetical protein
MSRVRGLIAGAATLLAGVTPTFADVSVPTVIPSAATAAIVLRALCASRIDPVTALACVAAKRVS